LNAVQTLPIDVQKLLNAVKMQLNTIPRLPNAVEMLPNDVQMQLIGDPTLLNADQIQLNRCLSLTFPKIA